MVFDTLFDCGDVTNIVPRLAAEMPGISPEHHQPAHSGPVIPGKEPQHAA
ncbi:MAG: hypothetical protein Kow0047_33980 [Anaerolineae bacterium]